MLEMHQWYKPKRSQHHSFVNVVYLLYLPWERIKPIFHCDTKLLSSGNFALPPTRESNASFGPQSVVESGRISENAMAMISLFVDFYASIIKMSDHCKERDSPT